MLQLKKENAEEEKRSREAFHFTPSKNLFYFIFKVNKLQKNALQRICTEIKLIQT